MRTVWSFILLLAAGGEALAQSAAPRLEFEVAPVKPSVEQSERGMRIRIAGGPGTRDPGRFVTENFSLFTLVTVAYNVERYQLSAPGWMNAARFDITAKVPEGNTREQFRIMLQNLIGARFKLALHREKKEMSVYDLVVRGDHPKLKESMQGREPSSRLDKEGLPILPLTTRNGQSRLDVIDESMEQLASRLSSQVGRPVTDATGLKGKYDITLTWAREGMRPTAEEPAMPASGDDSGPGLFAALEQQLGLKLAPRKGLVEILAIDQIEKAPAGDGN